MFFSYLLRQGQVDNNGMINVLNEVFNVGEEFISEYIWATIYTGKQRMEVYYRAQDQDVAALIKEFDYDIYEHGFTQIKIP